MTKKIIYLIGFILFFSSTHSQKRERQVESIDLSAQTPTAIHSTKSVPFQAESVLKSGLWVKIKVEETGIYRISDASLRQWGFKNPGKVAIYGNGGTLLPLKNSDFRADDLMQCPIMRQNGNILFFAMGAGRFKHNSESDLFEYETHHYDNSAYYFLTEQEEIKAVQIVDNSHLATTTTLINYNNPVHHEKEQYNILRSGKRWFGERFDANTTERSFSLNIPNLDTSREAFITTVVAGRSSQPTSFSISINGQVASSANIYAVSMSSQEKMFANDSKNTVAIALHQPDVAVKIKYNFSLSNSLGWLDYITINAWSELKMSGSQLLFRNTDILQSAEPVTLLLKEVSSNTVVWDVTQPWNPIEQKSTKNGNTLSFNMQGGKLSELLAFNPDGNFPEPTLVGNVANQNLHALQPINYVIVTHPKFYDQAKRLSQFHMEEQNISVAVVTSDQIYNEFSSGSRDITAIRDFLRMLYARSTPDDPNKLRYLLLFGDGSYDNKNDTPENTNYLPTYQSVNSLHQSESYVSDDFFGYLDDHEGDNDASGRLDIGIGRFPVQTIEQAENVTNKSIRHLKSNDAGRWKKKITFVADDGDASLHMIQADKLVKSLAQRFPEFDFSKIYLDAYKTSITSSGKKYPEVYSAINQTINDGTIIFNYVGHGGGNGLSNEGVVDIRAIQSWNNLSRMALFVTATCEFARYDDKTATTAGEHVFLNKQGGGIGLFTTTRIAYSHNNETINTNLYDFAFEKDIDGHNLRMGEIIQKTKNSTGTNTYKMNFTLIGDPALPLIYPEYNVTTDLINGNVVAEASDTLKAMSVNTISGSIRNNKKEIISNFDGVINIVLYDKQTAIKTYGNEGPVFAYNDYQNIIFNGSVEVKKGKFTADFIIPKDIKYNVGNGRISYYAVDNINKQEAGGATTVLVGDMASTPIDDTQGPKIKLWLNGETFKNGQRVGVSPLLMATLEDESGINTTGIGIGHDIVLFIDDDRANPIILNSHYKASETNFRSGTLLYQLGNLKPGRHTIELRAWDNMNNSASEIIHFEVKANAGIGIEAHTIYPVPCHAGSNSLNLKFTHDQYNAILTIESTIFSLSGQSLEVQKQTIKAEGNSTAPISISTKELNDGIYLLNVKIQSDNGKEGSFSQKIVIIQ